MIKTSERVINGRKWQCTQWSGSKNLAMFHKVTSLLLPMIAHGVTPGKNMLSLSADVNIAGAVDTLLANLGTSQALDAFVKELLANVHIDGRHLAPAEFDVAFVGPQLFDLAPGILFVIETNFGDFSKLAAIIMSKFADQQKKAEAEAAQTKGSEAD